ncbi:hypothetical protein ACS0TY_029736 [Phlomoides rotata]
MFESEKYGGVPKANGCLEAFRNISNELGLFDLGAAGPKHTWTNKRRGPDLILERLDRFLANQKWMSHFANVEVRNLNFYGSDHMPVLLEVLNGDGTMETRHPKQFMFEHKWLMEGDYDSMLRNSWETHAGGSLFHERLKGVSGDMRRWARDTLGNLSARIKQVKNKLDDKLNMELGMWDSQGIQRLESEMNSLLNKEEIH